MNPEAYSQRLWRGRVTSRENIGFFIPMWLYFAVVVYIELRHLDERLIIVAFWPVFVVSTIPFFQRRVGLTRWWLFGALLPAIAGAVILQILRSLHV